MTSGYGSDHLRFRFRIFGHQTDVIGGTGVDLKGGDSIHVWSPAGSYVAITTPVGVVALSVSRSCMCTFSGNNRRSVPTHPA